MASQDSLKRLDKVILSEPTAILNLVFASELSEVFNTKNGEIRLIRHCPIILRKRCASPASSAG